MVISLQKAGGISAIVHASAYLVAILLYFLVLGPVLEMDPRSYLEALPERIPLLYTWIFIGYWVSAICLVLVIVALHRSLNTPEGWLLSVSSAFGLIWAALIIGSANLMLNNFVSLPSLAETQPDQALAVWLALSQVETGLVSGNEFVGGLWSVSLSAYALKHSMLSKGVNITGIVVGSGGLISIVPPLTEIGSSIFAIGMILWFAWLGVVMLRKLAR